MSPETLEWVRFWGLVGVIVVMILGMIHALWTGREGIALVTMAAAAMCLGAFFIVPLFL